MAGIIFLIPKFFCPVNLSALGMVQDNTVLEGYGFKFGQGPYRISATRIDTGRYRVSIQSMSRPNDNDSKAIKLKTAADTILPVRVPASPEGKYTCNTRGPVAGTEQPGSTTGK